MTVEVHANWASPQYKDGLPSYGISVIKSRPSSLCNGNSKNDGVFQYWNGSLGPFHQNMLTLIQAWIVICMPSAIHIVWPC